MKIQVVGEGDEDSDIVYERLYELKTSGKFTGTLEYIRNVEPIRRRGLYHNLVIIINDIFLINIIPESNEELLKKIDKYK